MLLKVLLHLSLIFAPFVLLLRSADALALTKVIFALFVLLLHSADALALTKVLSCATYCLACR